jgi:hypothetical protein
MIDKRKGMDSEIHSNQSFLTIDEDKPHDLVTEKEHDMPLLTNTLTKKKKLYEFAIDGLNPTTLDNFFDVDNGYQVVLLLIISNNKGNKLLTLVMGEIIRNVKHFNNLFSISELIYDAYLSYEEKIIFENDFVNNCIAVNSDMKVLYNYPNIQCNYQFEYIGMKFNFDGVYKPSTILNLGDFTNGHLIYSSKGDELLHPDNVVLFESFENYMIYYTQLDIIRRLQSISSFTGINFVYVLVFNTEEYLDRKIFMEIFKHFEKKQNINLLIYRLSDDMEFMNSRNKSFTLSDLKRLIDLSVGNQSC